MAKTTQELPPEFVKMSVPERIDYVQFLWNSISADAETVPVPKWHKRILDLRLKHEASSKGRSKSWPQVRREIERALRRRRRQ